MVRGEGGEKRNFSLNFAEFMEGGPLSSLLRSRKEITFQQQLKWLKEIAAGVAFLHKVIFVSPFILPTAPIPFSVPYVPSVKFCTKIWLQEIVYSHLI